VTHGAAIRLIADELTQQGFAFHKVFPPRLYLRLRKRDVAFHPRAFRTLFYGGRHFRLTEVPSARMAVLRGIISVLYKHSEEAPNGIKLLSVFQNGKRPPVERINPPQSTVAPTYS